VKGPEDFIPVLDCVFDLARPHGFTADLAELAGATVTRAARGCRSPRRLTFGDALTRNAAREAGSRSLRGSESPQHRVRTPSNIRRGTLRSPSGAFGADERSSSTGARRGYAGREALARRSSRFSIG
jgi:hypothetical protein